MGKHNYGWASMNAIPATHLAPNELMEGGRGCGGCHNMGIKTDEQKKELRDKVYPYNYPFLLTFMHTNGANWNEMTKDLGEIKELARTMRATYK